jgi:hypothetical protein
LSVDRRRFCTFDISIDLGDARERAQHLGLQLLLERRQRQCVLVVVLAALARAFAAGRAIGAIRTIDLGRRRHGSDDRLEDGWTGDGLGDFGRLGFARRAALCRLEVDHVAQQEAAFVDRVAPGEQRGDRHRALADAADHLVLAGLDALGDLDFALAAQQLDAAHLAQVHAHRIVGAAEFLVLASRLGRHHGGLGGLRRIGGGRGLFLLLGLDDVDAGLRQHGHRVLDLLGGHLIGRQGGVQLVVGDVAALLALLDELLELGPQGIEEGGVGAFVTRLGRFGLRYGCCFGRHFFSWTLRQTGLPAGLAVFLAARRGRRMGGPARVTLLLYGA